MKSARTEAILMSSLFRRTGAREAAVLLALAWFIPFAIHLVPWSGARPLGAYLLPVFWTTLVAVYFHGEIVGLTVGLFAPILNLIVTGQPAAGYFWKTCAEVVVFALLMAWVARRTPRILMLAAPFAYAIAKTVAAAVLAPDALFGSAAALGGFFGHMVTGNLPGLVALAAINAGLVWFYPKGSRGEN